MSGIGGIVGAAPAPRAVQAITERLALRGPAGGGFAWVSRGEIRTGEGWPRGEDEIRALLIERWRAGPPAGNEVAVGPRVSADGRFAIALDGVVYNAGALREELRASGECEGGGSDADLILAGFAHWGTGIFRRLNGAFALAILDAESGRLTLARDHFGIRPLYYAGLDTGFGFASEVSALIAAPGVSRRIDPHKVYEYLYFGWSGHGVDTLISGVKELRPAHYLEIDLREGTAGEQVCYWSPIIEPNEDITFAEAATRLRELHLENVAAQSAGSGTLGALLSGGVDSSSNLMAMRSLKGRGGTIDVFTFIADDPQISEQLWVELVAEVAAARIHEVRLSPAELQADLQRLISIQDVPFGGTSIYAQYRVLRAARDAGMGTMLDGQGADEVLGGYASHREARFASLLASGQWRAALRFGRTASSWPGQDSMLRKAVPFILPSPLLRFARRVRDEGKVPPWLNAVWFKERGVALQIPLVPLQERTLRPELTRALSEIRLPPLLRYADRNAMATGVEVRFPFLSPALAEFVFSLPEEFIVAPDGATKAILRGAMRGLVPDPILDRRDKIGFATPEQHWLNALGDWVDSIVRSDVVASCPVLIPAGMSAEWTGIINGAKAFDSRVWRWLNLVEWSRSVGAEYD